MCIDKLKVYAVEIMLLIIPFALFGLNIINRRIIACVLTLSLIIVYLVLKKQKVESAHKKQVTITMIILAITYLVIFYFMGLYFGYYKASVKFGMWGIKNYLLPTVVIIITSEYIRNILLMQNAKTKIVSFIIMCLIDIISFGNIRRITTLEDMLILVGFIIFSSISNNLLFNYISKRYGALPIIVYRIMTTVYAYIIPFLPNVDMFLRTVFRMTYPYIIYHILVYIYYNKQQNVVSYKSKKVEIIIKSIICIMILLITLLISCRFKYGILVLASGSMSGTIDMGDAIVFEQYEDQKLEIGEVPVFNKDNMKIVHRIVDISEVDGQVRYYTKGDANQNNDEGYILKEQIVGIVKFKIKYIGYPTLWLRRLFK